MFYFREKIIWNYKINRCKIKDCFNVSLLIESEIIVYVCC